MLKLTTNHRRNKGAGETMKNKFKTMYMHTLNGKPAFYCEDQQICYACHGQLKFPDGLADSLKQIRKEHKSSQMWRRAQGFSESSSVYGYLRVKEEIREGD